MSAAAFPTSTSNHRILIARVLQISSCCAVPHRGSTATSSLRDSCTLYHDPLHLHHASQNTTLVKPVHTRTHAQTTIPSHHTKTCPIIPAQPREQAEEPARPESILSRESANCSGRRCGILALPLPLAAPSSASTSHRYLGQSRHCFLLKYFPDTSAFQSPFRSMFLPL